MVLANGPSVGWIDCLPDGLARPLAEFQLAWANARVVAVQQHLCGVFPASRDWCRLFVFVVGISVFDGGSRLARSSAARKAAILCLMAHPSVVVFHSRLFPPHPDRP